MHFIDPVREVALPELEAGKSVVLVGERAHFSALGFAAYAARNDRTVVLGATQNGYQAIQFATYDCRNDAGLVLEALYSDSRVFSFATRALRSDIGVTVCLSETRGLQFVYRIRCKGHWIHHRAHTHAITKLCGYCVGQTACS